MISSVMEGFKAERAALAAVITGAGLIPWWAEDAPNEFRELSAAELSFAMARQCDLYLLVIFPRYGSQALSASRLSVTHEEFRQARAAHPRAVRAFLLADAITQADMPDFHAFIEEVKDFERGQWTAIVANEAELRAAVRATLERWQRDGQVGRDTYVQSVQTEYRRFLNPATGQEMEYSATVQLKVRAQLTPSRDRPEWEGLAEQEDQAGTGRPGTQDADARGRSRRAQERDQERDKERERLRAATQSPPQIAAALLSEYQRVVILGDVGAGKSTLLKRLAHDSADAYQRGQDSRLPILVTAIRLGAMARQYSSESLAELVGRVQEEETRTEALRPTIRSTISNALANGQSLLLLDGLDEATTAEQTAVLALLEQIGGNWAILASRPAAYRGQPAGWQVADLLPLGATQRRELVLQVFRLERQSDEPPPSEETLYAEAKELESALQERRIDLAAWAGNPLLLTLIAVQFVRDHRLPENRAHIYEFAIEDLQRQRPMTARRYLTNSQLQRLLQTLALRMQEALRRTTTVASVRDTYLRNELAEFADSAMRTAVALEVLRRAGVLQAERATEEATADSEKPQVSDQDSYTFVHLSFREYLAASAIARLPDATRRDLARRHALHAEWEQVFLLLVSRLDASGRAADTDALIRTLIAADDQDIPALGGRDPTHLALRLATNCAAARGKQPQTPVWNALRATWWRQWRAEERRYRGVSEWALVGLAWENADDREVTEGRPPQTLGAGLPLLLERVDPRRQFPRARWWVGCGLLSLVALGLLVLAQVTLSMLPLADIGYNGWGAGLAQRLPMLLLTTIGVLIALRLYGRWARASAVRHALFVHLLNSIDRSLVHALGDARAVEPLLPLLRDEDWSVRRVAAETLGQLGDARAVEPLMGLLDDADSDVQRAAAQALEQLGEVEELGELGEADWGVGRVMRGVTGEVLRQPSDVDAVESLLTALRNESSSVRYAAAQALGQLGDARADEPRIVKRLPGIVGRLPGAAPRQLGNAVVEPLLAQLRDADWHVRQAAVKAAVEPLIGLLGDADQRVQRAAAAALGQLGDARAVEPLLSALRDAPVEPLPLRLGDADSGVRHQAAEALGQLGDVRAVEPLIGLLGDAGSDVQRAAAEALGRLGDVRAVEPLLRALGDEDSDVRQVAAEALGQLGDGRAVEPLLTALRDPDWSVRRAAAAALGQLGDARAVEPLLTALRDEDSDVRQAAEAALGQLGEVGETQALPFVVRRAQHLRWGWALPPLAALHGLTDWPVLIAVLLAQVALLAPAVGALLLPPLAWLSGVTAGWQLPLLVALWVVAYASIWDVRSWIIYKAQGNRRESIATAEQLIRRYVADARAHEVAHLDDAGRIEPIDWLVEDQEVRIVEEPIGGAQSLFYSRE
jgi:HEAT repeat protein